VVWQSGMQILSYYVFGRRPIIATATGYCQQQ
jgi:hypothetical protein